MHPTPNPKLLPNRMTPFGDLIATDAPCAFFGNRGRLHNEAQEIIKQSVGDRWIICATEGIESFSDLMGPTHYTEVFFLDEATAFAAGHRPCASSKCRLEAWTAFAAAWERATGTSDIKAGDVDLILRDERPRPRRGLTVSRVPLVDLPDGAMVSVDGVAKLVFGDQLWAWSLDGYHHPEPRGTATVDLITPRSTVAAFAHGYTPQMAIEAG